MLLTRLTLILNTLGYYSLKSTRYLNPFYLNVIVAEDSCVSFLILIAEQADIARMMESEMGGGR